MFDIHFLRPDYFALLLVAVPLVLGLWYVNFRARLKARQDFGDRKLIRRHSKPLSMRRESFLVITWLAAVALVVAAIAGPTSSSLPITVKSGSLQVVAVVDVSKSMGAEDYRPYMPPKDGYEPELYPGRYGSRLDFVHNLLTKQVMPAIIGNQLGVVFYSGEGFEQVTLTDDWTAAGWVLDNWMKIGNAPGGGSDYAYGLEKALEMLQRDKIPGRQQVIIVFTDGGFTGDEEHLTKVIEKIKEAKVEVKVVGVGGTTPLPIKIYDGEGNVTGVETRDNAPVETAIDTPAIDALAAKFGTQAVILEPQSNATLKINWATTLGGTKTETKDKPIFQYPLALAFILLSGLFMRGLLKSFRTRRTR
jgi:hypothetical protein